MAFPILEKIISLFHKRTKERERSKPALDASMKSVENHELPPPYSPGHTSPGLHKEKSQATQDSDGVVQICPHETLSFDRIQRLTNLPNFKLNGKKIDALTPTSEHHHRGHDKDTKEAQDSCKPLGYNISTASGYSDIVASLKGFGTYVWKSSGPVPGILLSFHWEMRCLDSGKVKCDSPTELQAFLKKTKIQLCPHKNISDIDVVNGIYGIVNPLGKPIDPIDRYMAKEVGYDCERCGTRIKVYKRKNGSERTCRVDTKRFLGKAEAKEDSVWLAQCTSVQSELA